MSLKMWEKKHNQGDSFRIDIASYITHKSNNNIDVCTYIVFLCLAIHTSVLNRFCSDNLYKMS